MYPPQQPHRPRQRHPQPRTEWVNQIRTVSTIGSSPYYVQESLHPSSWGQLAMRNCLRQVWNAGNPRSGSCTVGNLGTARLTRSGEPSMILGPLEQLVPDVQVTSRDPYV